MVKLSTFLFVNLIFFSSFLYVWTTHLLKPFKIFLIKKNHSELFKVFEENNLLWLNEDVALSGAVDDCNKDESGMNNVWLECKVNLAESNLNNKVVIILNDELS